MVFVKEVGINIGGETILEFDQIFAGKGKIPQEKNHQRRGNPNTQTEFPAVLCPDFPDVTVHGFGVDAARAADAAQIAKQPLPARADFFCVFIGLLQSQAFEGEAVTRET